MKDVYTQQYWVSSTVVINKLLFKTKVMSKMNTVEELKNECQYLFQNKMFVLVKYLIQTKQGFTGFLPIRKLEFTNKQYGGLWPELAVRKGKLLSRMGETFSRRSVCLYFLSDHVSIFIYF